MLTSHVNPIKTGGGGGEEKARGLSLAEIAATGGLGGNQNYFVNSYLVVGRALNPFLEQSSHSVIRRRLEKPGGSDFYQFDSVQLTIEVTYRGFFKCTVGGSNQLQMS